MRLCYDDATIYCPTVGFATNSIYCHDNYLHLIVDYSTVTHDRSDRTTEVLYREAVFGVYDVVLPSVFPLNSRDDGVMKKKKKDKKKREEKRKMSFCSILNLISAIWLDEVRT